MASLIYNNLSEKPSHFDYDIFIKNPSRVSSSETIDIKPEPEPTPTEDYYLLDSEGYNLIDSEDFKLKVRA